ncbi:nucleotidyltransferase domain-containing protein [Candidatus Poriferisodalis sp.]|uniref:nucleotidyltransferase domain-containing protein n=1 Tax=Candidatus Poriferisodalis sp. TaxID=3101277 RepID=UPI003B0294B5
MGRREQVIGRFRAEIRDAAARNKASAIALVGSVARGDDDAQSDHDFLVEVDQEVVVVVRLAS